MSGMYQGQAFGGGFESGEEDWAAVGLSEGIAEVFALFFKLCSGLIALCIRAGPS